MIYPRELIQRPAPLCKQLEIATDGLDLKAWINSQVPDGKNAWILGHDLDGLIWGRISAGDVSIAHDVKVSSGAAVWVANGERRWGAPLRAETLMDLRIFCPDFELRIWRDNWKLRGCKVEENHTRTVYAYDEPQILISTHLLDQEKTPDGVTYSLVQGAAGQRQALPVDWDGRNQEYRLWVRHYAWEDEQTGMLSFQESRVLALQKQDQPLISE
jgi:CRISPR-associated protein (TIGR03984 family)